MRYALREALLAFRRAPPLAALGVATIAFSLFSLGLFGLVALNIRDALARVEERVEVRAFFADSTPPPAVTAAAAAVRAYPEVAAVDVVSSAEALAGAARRELGEFRDVFDAAVLPPSLEVRLRPGRRDADDAARVADRARRIAGIDDVRYGEEWVEKFTAVRAMAVAAGAALGAAFALAAFIIVGATIRMAVLARTREIQLMRLVGATDAFIRLPFLLEGLMAGLMGGALALALTRLAQALVSRYVLRVEFLPAWAVALGVVLGGLLGLVGSVMSVGRHLRLVGGERRRLWGEPGGGPGAAARALVALLAASALGAQRQPPRPAPNVAGAAAEARLRGGRDELARVRQERAALELRLRGLQATAHDLRDEVANLDRQADATARLVAALDRQLAVIGAEERDAAGRLARASDARARQQVKLRRRLVEIWKRGPLYEAEALLSAASFGDLVARYKYLHELARRDRVVVRRVERLRDEVAGQRALLVRLQAELARNRGDRAGEERGCARLASGAGRRSRRQQQQQGAQRRLAQVARDEARLEGVIASLEAARRRAEARAAEQRLAASRAADARAVAATAARLAAARGGAAGWGRGDRRGGGHGAPARADAGGPVAPAGAARLAAGRLDWPARGGLLYRFGRVVGANNTTTRWNGVGIAVPAGTPVRAAAGGQVALAQVIGTYGLTVIIQHGGGDYSVYGSLQRADVRVGDTVARGQTLGTAGAADPDLPPHLHFELRPAGRAVDPLPYLP